VAVPHRVSFKVSFETVSGYRWLQFTLMTLIFELTIRTMLQGLSLSCSEVQCAFWVSLCSRACTDTPSRCTMCAAEQFLEWAQVEADIISCLASCLLRNCTAFACTCACSAQADPCAALSCGEFKSLFTRMLQCQMTSFSTLVLQMLGNANLLILSNELTCFVSKLVWLLDMKFWLHPELVLLRSIFLLAMH